MNNVLFLIVWFILCLIGFFFAASLIYDLRERSRKKMEDEISKRILREFDSIRTDLDLLNKKLSHYGFSPLVYLNDDEDDKEDTEK